jgi:hypothetical protein
MRRMTCSAISLLLVLSAAAQPQDLAWRTRVAVAWNDAETGRGVVRAMSTQAPFQFVTPALDTDPDAVLHRFGKRLYVVSRPGDTIAAIDVETWTVAHTYVLPKGSAPLDVAVVSAGAAYISRAGASRLLKLELEGGGLSESVDLTPVAGPDGVPDMDRMLAYGRRLFVQMRREDGGDSVVQPALAVIDLVTEQLIDANPATLPIDPVVLSGTAPRMRMQVIGSPARLFVSATGGFFDDGGIEAVDPAGLVSLGLAVAEADSQTGADLGAFVMVKPEFGYLTFSTDLLLSSHLHAFRPFAGVDPNELHVSLNYFAPALAHDALTSTLYVPHSFNEDGVHVFNAATGQQLTPQPTLTSGQVTDLLLLTRLTLTP